MRGNPGGYEVNRSQGALSDRQFGLAIAGVLCLVGSIAWVLFDAALTWVFAIAATLLAIALAAPGLLFPLNRVWHALALRITGLTNRLILLVLFYLVISPAGLLMRMIRIDPLSRGPRRSESTYWKPVQRQVNAETLADQF